MKRTWLIAGVATLVFAWLLAFHPGYRPYELRVEATDTAQTCDAALEVGAPGEGRRAFQLQIVPGKAVSLGHVPLRSLRVNCSAPSDYSLNWQGGPALTGTDSSYWQPQSEDLPDPSELSYRPPSLVFAQALAGLIVAGLIALGLEIARSRRWRAWFSLAMLVQVPWILAWWPGFTSMDAFEVLKNTARYQLGTWFSWIYSAYVLALEQLGHDIGLETLITSFALAAVSGAAFAIARARGASRAFCWIAFGLLYLPPMHSALAQLHSRDVPFSIGYAALALAPVASKLLRGSGRRPSWPELLLLSLAVGIIATMRTEAMFVVLAYPLTCWASGALEPRSTLRLGAVTLACYALLSAVLPRVIGVPQQPPVYELTTWVSPLGNILRQPHEPWRDSASDEAALSRIWEVEKLVELYSPDEIPAFHANHFRKNISDKDVREIRPVFLGLIARNPGLYLENRLDQFTAQIGYRHGFYFVTDDVRQATSPAAIESLSILGISRSSGIAWLRTPLKAWSDRIIHNTGIGTLANLRLWIGGPLLALIACALLMTGFRKTPACAAGAALVLARAMAVFLTSPASQLKYYWSVQLFAILVLPLWIAERKLSCTTRR